jgi:uncharacterized membrane protein
MGRDEILRATLADRSTNVADVVKELANHSSEQVPLYYVLLRTWCDAVGEDPAKMRMLSALFGTLLIGGVYLLGAEIFNSRLAGGYAAALLALSPFHLSFADEARPYALWALTICLSTIALWRAVKQPSTSRWLLFALALTACEYTHASTLLVIPAFCTWILIQKRFSKGFLLSAGLSVLSFLPWLVLAGKHSTNSNWLVPSHFHLTGCITVPILWIVPSAFFDKNILALCPEHIVCTVILLVAVWLMLLKATRPASTLALSLFVGPLVALIAFSICVKSSVAVVPRYYCPSLVAVYLCVGAGLACLGQFRSVACRATAVLLFSLLLTMGAFSCFVYSAADDWHRNGQPMLGLAKVLNTRENPVVVLCDPPPCPALVLCRLLREDAKVMIESDPESQVQLSTGYFRVNIAKTPDNAWRGQYIPPLNAQNAMFKQWR